MAPRRVLVPLLLVLVAASAAAPGAKDHGRDPAPEAPEPPDLAGDLASVAVLAAGAGLVGGVLAWVSRAWWKPRLAGLARWTPVLTLFSRFTHRDAVRHPTRARIVQLLAERPGLTTAEMGRALPAHPGTLEHHLRVLDDHGRVKSVRAGRDRIWFVAGSGSDAEAHAALAPAPRRRLAEVLRREPGLHAAALAERVGIARSTVHHHLAALEDAGLVRVERGLRARCFPTERLAGLAAPAFDDAARNR